MDVRKMSSKMKISYHNYDVVLKDSFSVFDNKVLDFLKLDIPRIKGFIETEFATIETKKEGLDLNFLLEDNTILHIEEEAQLSNDDIIRFASYHLQLYKRYKTEITTVVICINKPKIENTMINTQQLKYQVNVLEFWKEDADEELIKIRKQIESGEPINELELIFMILKETKKTRTELLKEIVEVEKMLPHEKEMKEKIIAMTLGTFKKITGQLCERFLFSY